MVLVFKGHGSNCIRNRVQLAVVTVPLGNCMAHSGCLPDIPKLESRYIYDVQVTTKTKSRPDL